MSTIYRNGDSVIKVTAPKEFTDKAAAIEAEIIAEARVAKMKLNLKSSEYREMFAQWERLKQESSQRLQRIEQLSSSQHKQRNQQLQSHQMRMQQRTTESSRNIINNNTDNNTESSNVLKHLKLMKWITGT